MQPVLQILQPGFGGSVQDNGRHGWRRMGVPVSGFMDEHAARWANRLVGNPPDTPVLEFLLQGARLAALSEVWIAVTGADASANVPSWHPIRLTTGNVLTFAGNIVGNWMYVAIAGGVGADRILGSASTYARGRLGRVLGTGDLVLREAPSHFHLPAGVAGQTAPSLERRNYARPPRLRVWSAPQFHQFNDRDRHAFFEQEWTISSQSDRVGFRLEGPPLTSRLPQLISEPVRPGTIQVPENGGPIVTMRDGPTVGGYAKFGLVEPADLSWLAQCRPGQAVRFQLMDETRSQL
jgi:biotin-dependent carboxylase-like uncharacterized protein